MRVGIIGGGITGLTAAYCLQKVGASTTIIEAESAPGGLATTFDFGPFHWDKFYHCILTTDHFLLNLLDELGLSSELRWTETKTGFYSKYGLESMSSAMELLRFRPLSLWEKFRLGLGVLYAARLKNVASLEDITASDWLSGVFGRGVYEKVWLPLLNSKLGACREEAAASWIWATIFRYYSTREKTKSKKEVLGYVRGGYRVVFEKLIDRLQSGGTTFFLNHPVERIETVGGVLSVRAGGSEFKFDRVLFTGPSGVLAKVAPGVDETLARKLQTVKYLGVVCIALLLKRRLSRFYITNLIESQLPFTGIIEMTQLISGEETAGRHLVYLPKYTVPGDPVFKLKDDEIWSQMRAGLRRVHPDLKDEDIEAVFVFRAPYVQPVPSLGYTRNIPGMETNVPGLFLANSTFIVNGTLNNNEMIRIAQDAAERIIGQGIRSVAASTPAEAAVTRLDLADRAVANLS